MKLELLNAMLSEGSKYFALLGIMINGKTKEGKIKPGLTRYLIFVAYDPIGWRLQFFFRSFSDAYERNWMMHVMQAREQREYPNGRPIKTGGVKAEDKVK